MAKKPKRQGGGPLACVRLHAGIGTRVLAHSRVDPAISMGLLSSANRCGCKNILSCNLLRCACCCSWIRSVCGGRTTTSNKAAAQQEASDAERKAKRKLARGLCGGAVREAEEPLTSEAKKKRTNTAATIPEPQKCKWTKKARKKKKTKNEQNGLAALVEEISLSSKKKFSFLNFTLRFCLVRTTETDRSTRLSMKKGRASQQLFLHAADSPKHRAAAGEILRIGNHNIPSRVFTFRELVDATNSFCPENLLGEGGFGRVYKGCIPDTMEVINEHFIPCARSINFFFKLIRP